MENYDLKDELFVQLLSFNDQKLKFYFIEFVVFLALISLSFLLLNFLNLIDNALMMIASSIIVGIILFFVFRHFHLQIEAQQLYCCAYAIRNDDVLINHKEKSKEVVKLNYSGLNTIRKAQKLIRRMLLEIRSGINLNTKASKYEEEGQVKSISILAKAINFYQGIMMNYYGDCMLADSMLDINKPNNLDFKKGGELFYQSFDEVKKHFAFTANNTIMFFTGVVGSITLLGWAMIKIIFSDFYKTNNPILIIFWCFVVGFMLYLLVNKAFIKPKLMIKACEKYFALIDETSINEDTTKQLRRVSNKYLVIVSKITK